MRGEVPGVERRRRWSDEEKLSIAASVGVDGASVTQVGRRHEVTRSRIHGWRHELKRKGLPSAQPPVRLVPLPALPPADAGEDERPGPGEAVEVLLRGARGLRVPVDLDEASPARLVRVVEAA